MSENKLYIIAGANGSGKSTIAKELLKNEDLAFLNADDIAKGLSPDNIEKVKITAGKKLFEELNELFLVRKSFAIETTLSGAVHIKTIRRAKEAGYKVYLLYVYLDNVEMCIERIKARVKQGGHFIPDDDVRRRYIRSLNNFRNVYKDLADGWFLYYNGMETAAVANSEGAKTEILNVELYALFEEIANV